MRLKRKLEGMQRAKNISAFGRLENGKRMTKHMSLKLPSTGRGSNASNPDGSSSAGGAGGGVAGGLKHQNTVTGANFAAMKRRNKVGQISTSTRERWRQTTRNIKVRERDRESHSDSRILMCKTSNGNCKYLCTA